MVLTTGVHNAGFAGLSDFSLVHSVALVALETFAPIVLSLALLARLGRQAPPSMTKQILQTMSFAHQCRALMAVLCVALHRRHLLIWAVFAPKFLFEIAFSVVFQSGWICMTLLSRTT